MLKKISVGKKWQNELFRYRGIRRVFSRFPSDSNEILIFENFLREFFKDNGKGRIYVLMSQLDYNLYESTFKAAAINVFETLLDSHWYSVYNNEKCHFKIKYRNLKVIVILN